MDPTSGSSSLANILLTVSAAITIGGAYYCWYYLPKKMGEAYRRSLYTFAAAVETRDSGTIGHAQRVAAHAVAVARVLGVREPELTRIERAAVLRDVGKVNIPQKLLNKRDPLTEDEWEKLQSHSRLGADIVSSIPFISDTGDLILHHHESWDGSGYPNGLVKEEIPLGSRILAVATDFDAAISDRPYHKAQSVATALEQIRLDRGTKYDPRVVDAFFSIVERENRQIAQ